MTADTDLGPTPMLSRAMFAAIVVVAWTVFGAVSAAQLYVRESTQTPGVEWRSFVTIVYFYWAWALVTPATFALGRWTYAAGPRWRTGIVAGAGASVIIVLQSALYALCNLVLEEKSASTGIATATTGVLTRHLAGNILTVVSLLSGYVAFCYYRASQARRFEAAQAAMRARELERTLEHVRLDALLAQLRPHFLFNTLNSVSSLVAMGDYDTATRAIARLGDLLRETFSDTGESEVALTRELQFARDYLAIAALRFGARLRVVEDVAEGTLSCLVPRFVLQPLIENALRHGIEANSGEGEVELRAVLENNMLVLSVADSGPGFGRDAQRNGGGSGIGIGLSIVRERLAQLYGDGATLTAANRSGRGAIVTVRFRARTIVGSPFDASLAMPAPR